MPYLRMKNIDDEDTRVKFGKHIHKLHTENKYSFKKLNYLTKISISQLQLIEEGKTDTSITYAKTLATAFNLTLSQLFIYDTHPDDLNNTPNSSERSPSDKLRTLNSEPQSINEPFQ